MSLASAASCTAGGGDVSVGGGTGRMVLGDGLHRFINQACGKKQSLAHSTASAKPCQKEENMVITRRDREGERERSRARNAQIIY